MKLYLQLIWLGSISSESKSVLPAFSPLTRILKGIALSIASEFELCHDFEFCYRFIVNCFSMDGISPIDCVLDRSNSEDISLDELEEELEEHKNYDVSQGH